MDVVVNVTHGELLDEQPPPDAWRFWVHYLSRQAVAVYHDLRQRDGQSIDLRLWATRLGTSPHGIGRALRELERHGFVDLVDTPSL